MRFRIHTTKKRNRKRDLNKLNPILLCILIMLDDTRLFFLEKSLENYREIFLHQLIACIMQLRLEFDQFPRLNRSQLLQDANWSPPA